MKTQWISGGPKKAAAAMLLALGLGGLAVAGADRLLNPPATFKFASADAPASRNSFAPVVKKVLPSVVTITSSRVMKTGFQGGEDGIPPMFRQFFGGDEGNRDGQFRQPRQQREEGLGSGVIVSPNGYILTNNHVVDHTTTVTVIMQDKHEYKARVVGSDPKTDIAVLKVDAGSLDPITIGDSDKVQVGDYVLAVGNPFGVSWNQGERESVPRRRGGNSPADAGGNARGNCPERTAGEQQRRCPARHHRRERHRPNGPAVRIAG